MRDSLAFDPSVGSQPRQLSLGLTEVVEGGVLYEYAVLATSLDEELEALAQRYRDRGDAENNFDERKNQWGLRGRIRDSYEGGVRVPFIARWPGRIPTEQVIDTPAIAYDLFPTLLKLAGGRLPSDRVYDGQDIWPLLAGKGRFRREKPFVWVYADNVTAIRDGRWKLHAANRDRPLDPPELYDIERDPTETRNLHEQHPEVVARLRTALDEMQKQKQVPKVWSLRYPVRDAAKRPGGVRRE